MAWAALLCWQRSGVLGSAAAVLAVRQQGPSVPCGGVRSRGPLQAGGLAPPLDEGAPQVAGEVLPLEGGSPLEVRPWSGQGVGRRMMQQLLSFWAPPQRLLAGRRHDNQPVRFLMQG